MIKLLDFFITKIEKHTKNEYKKELFRKILNSIDNYKLKRYGEIRLRYYRFFNFTVDDIDNIKN